MSLFEQVESRTLFSYDLAFVDAFTSQGTFSPGQTVNTQITFKNNGDVATPATKFVAYLANDTTDTSDEGSFGGLLTDDPTFDLPAIDPGQTHTVNLNRPLSQYVFNGGPYSVLVYAGYDGENFLANDSDLSNNVGFSSSQLLSVTGGLDSTGSSGGGDQGADSPIVGDLDPSFGGNGTVTSTFNEANLQTLATVFDSVNKVQYGLGQTPDGISIVRLDNFGNIDATYGTNGSIDLGPAGSIGSYMFRQPDGTILVAGYSPDGQTAFLARLTATGQIDTTFGNAGFASFSVPGVFGANAGTFAATCSAVGSDGLLYLGGTLTVGDGSTNAGVVRFTAGGVLDTSFGGTGGVTIDQGGNEAVGALAVQLKGQIVVAGTFSGKAGAVRLTKAGALDTKFGTKGTYTITAQAGADERITLAAIGAKDVITFAGFSATGGGTGSLPFAARMLGTGKADAKFGTKGVNLITGVGYGVVTPNTLLLTPEGGSLISVQAAVSLAGAATGNIGSALVRLGADGKLVNNFGENGIRITVLPDIAPAAVVNGTESLDDFTRQRNGAATMVDGGKVRVLASRDAGDNTNTTLTVTQLFGDGADIAPALASAFPGTVIGGSKTTIKVNVSDIGTLPVSGGATLDATLVPAEIGSAVVTGSVGSTALKLKLNAGQTAKGTVKVTIPKIASGLYNLVVKLTPTTAADLTATNNTASSNQSNITAKFADLGITLPQDITLPVGTKPFKVTLRVTNTGSDKSAGKGVVQVFVLGADETAPAVGATPVATTSVAVAVGPNGAFKDSPITFPLALSSIPPGGRLFFRLISPASASDNNSSNNDVFSTVLVAAVGE